MIRKILLLALCAGCGRPSAPAPAPTPVPVPTSTPASPLRALESAIRERIARLDSGEVAVSVIDFRTGRELHINGDVSMHAASTMKVPVLFSLFTAADSGRIALDSLIEVRNRFKSIADTSHYSLDPADDSEADLYTRVGTKLPARELARRMTVRSSNLATNILIDLLTPQRVAMDLGNLRANMRVLRGVEDIPAFRKGLNNTATSKGLATVLAAIARCQSNTRASCNEMIDILAAQEFNDMIPAGLPAGTRVAHKTGWITGIQHDAGIVLPPDSEPYVLVILTRGIMDRKVAAQTGADISKLVWDALTDPQWLQFTQLDAQSAALSALHERYRVGEISTRTFKHAELWRALTPYVDGNVRREEIGRSAEGRPIYLLSYGNGPTRVLLWSQMHGDESTATMALADLVKYLNEADDERTRLWRDQLTLLMIPMLNPDGAELFQRYNAYGIDINRDARRLSTPEAQALKRTRDRFEPQYGFNLHDQNARTRVGNTSNVAAIALLAPAPDASGAERESWTRAKRLASVLRASIEPFVPAHVARYDDTHNPRAFGDLIQSWGTSTVLIESGGWRDDPQKQYLRKVNFAALVAAFDAMANGSIGKADVALYTSLLENGPAANDLVIRGGTVVLPGLAPYRADITIDFADPTSRGSSSRIVEVGDLAGAQARDTIDATGLFIHPMDRIPMGNRRAIIAGAFPNLKITTGVEDTSQPRFVVMGSSGVQEIAAQEAVPAGTPHAAVGCYDVAYGEWKHPWSSVAPRDWPARIRLHWLRDLMPGSQRNDLAMRLIGQTSPYRIMPWRIVDADHIELVFSTGFTGYQFKVERAGENWQGEATMLSDVVTVGRPVPTAPVTMTRIACPAD